MIQVTAQKLATVLLLTSERRWRRGRGGSLDNSKQRIIGRDRGRVCRVRVRGSVVNRSSVVNRGRVNKGRGMVNRGLDGMSRARTRTRCGWL